MIRTTYAFAFNRVFEWIDVYFQAHLKVNWHRALSGEVKNLRIRGAKSDSVPLLKELRVSVLTILC